MHGKIACDIHWPVNMSNEALEYEGMIICTTKVASSLEKGDFFASLFML